MRIAGYSSLAFACVTLLFGVGVYWATRHELAYDLDQRILTDRVALLREAGETQLAAVVAARAAHGSQDMRYALLDPRGRVIAGEPIIAKPPLGWSNMDFVEDGEPDPTRAFASRQSGDAMLVVGADPEAIEDLSAHLVQLFAVAFGLIAVIGVIGSLILGRLLSRRLGAVNRTAEAIIAGDLKQRIPVGTDGDEFDTLGSTLNRMLDRIEGLLKNLRRVSGDIAHDLRTPLTRLRQHVESALASDGDPAALRSALAGALKQSDDALALFAGILAISEVEANSGLRMAPLDLSALVEDVVEGYRPAIEDAGRGFATTIEPGLVVNGNRQLLAQTLGNLLDNTLRHTGATDPVAVTLSRSGQRVRLVVADGGPGIAAEDRSFVFGRFARLDRSRSTPGNGLGLSLVAAVAGAHGGEVAIEDNDPGAMLIVVLPAA